MGDLAKALVSFLLIIGGATLMQYSEVHPGVWCTCLGLGVLLILKLKTTKK